MQRLVVDTNIFFNLEEIKDLGENTTQVMASLSDIFSSLTKSGVLEVYIPHSVWEEILSFFDQEPDELKKLATIVHLKTPQREKINIPGSVVYDLLSEFRKRSYRGMKIAEEEIRNAAQQISGKGFEGSGKKEFELALAPFLKKLRERYRNALRTKFIDSTADLDLLLLAKELDATLVTTDEGVLIWAKRLGVKTLPARLLKKKLLSLRD